MFFANRSNCLFIVSCASCDESREPLELHGEASLLKQIEEVFASPERRKLDTTRAGLRETGIAAMVQSRLDDLDVVVPQDAME